VKALRFAGLKRETEIKGKEEEVLNCACCHVLVSIMAHFLAESNLNR